MKEQKLCFGTSDKSLRTLTHLICRQATLARSCQCGHLKAKESSDHPLETAHAERNSHTSWQDTLSKQGKTTGLCRCPDEKSLRIQWYICLQFEISAYCRCANRPQASILRCFGFMETIKVMYPVAGQGCSTRISRFSTTGSSWQVSMAHFMLCRLINKAFSK